MDSKYTVLVSGGVGYIGQHTAVALIEAGFDVMIFDNFSNSERSAIEGIEKITGRKVNFEEVDTYDKAALKAVFEKYDFDSVIHFAAFKAVVESMTEPLKYYQNNLSSLMNICELMHQFNRPSVLISSSATVYGEAEALPVTEESPRQPATSPYGNTKQMCEDILRDCCRAYPGFNGIALRYFNPIGAHPSACIDELPRGMPNNLVPFITQTAAGIRECLSIFGDDYNTPDGTCLRDYIDESRETIPDAVDLLIKSGEATIRVLDTTSRWFGVTYTEDRPMVVEKLSRLHNEGVYPTPLFTQLNSESIKYIIRLYVFKS